MPSEVWISRCNSSTTFASLSGPPISEPEFHSLFASGPAALQPDGVYRVRHVDGRPWLTARFEPRSAGGGEIVLGTSYSSPWFVKDWVESFKLALTLAGPLGANVFDAIHHTLVSADALDRILDPEGVLLPEETATHRAITTRLAQTGAVPLEYALGGTVDETAVVLCLKLTAPEPASLAWLRDDPLALSPVSSEAGYLRDADVPLLRVLCREDGALQVWGAYSTARFSEWSRTAIELVDRLVAAHGGSVRMIGFGPLDDALRAEIAPRLDGLGTDFVTWALRR